MRFLPIFATAFGPWGSARDADLRTCRAAARTHVTANASSTVNLAFRVRAGSIEQRLGITTLGATDQDARCRARTALQHQGIGQQEQSETDSFGRRFSAFLRPVDLPTNLDRVSPGRGFSAVQAELLSLSKLFSDPVVAINLHLNHHPEALLVALDLAADWDLVQGHQEARLAFRPTSRRTSAGARQEALQSIGRSELASIKRAVALSAPKLGLTAELAADRPIPPVLLQRLAYAFSSDLGRLVELVPADHPAWIIKTSLSVLGEALGIASPFAFPVQDKFPFASPNF